MKLKFPVPKKKPTKKQLREYNRWVKYLKDSRLPESEIYSRAARFTEQGLKVKTA